MEFSRYLKIFPSPPPADTVLIYSTLRGSKITVSKGILEAARQGTLPESATQTLVRLGILVPDAKAEREQVRRIFALGNELAKEFVALVTLNLDCNLACPYCYEDHFRAQSYMSEATADLFVERVVTQWGGGRDVRLDFYGGEALLSVPLIRRISEGIRGGIAPHGGKYSFNLVTNGTLLTRQTVEELLPLGLTSAKITIDGPPDIHNRQRPFVSGRGSFSAIVANLKGLRRVMPVQLGGNYCEDNYRRFPELLDLLLEEGIAPEHLNAVIFTPVAPRAGEVGRREFSIGCACSSEPWLAEASLFLRAEILKRGFHTPKPRLSGCMVEFGHELVVSWDGGLYKCPAFMGWPDLKIGTLSEGVGDYRESHQLGNWDNEECLDCPYLPLCFGGCRFIQRVRTGSIKGLDCRRDFLDATLEGTLRQDLALRK